jgi:hypothetical protein
VKRKSGKVARKPANPWGATVLACPLLRIKVGRKWATGQFFVIFGSFFVQESKDFWPVPKQKWANGQQTTPKLTCY